MNPREITDIKESEQLLQRAEKEFPSEQSAEMFSEAFEALNDYLEYETPNSKVEDFISNLKLSYTRSTLSKLNEIDTQDFDIFFHYLVVLILKMKPEFDKLRIQHPDLGAAYDTCRERFKPQLDDIVHDLQRNT